MQTAFQFLRESEAHLNSTNFSQPVNEGDYSSDIIHRLTTQGWVFSELLDNINSYVNDTSHFNVTTVYGALLQLDMELLYVGLQVRTYLHLIECLLTRPC